MSRPGDQPHADEFPQHSQLPLRQRLPDYVAIWVVGAAGAAVIGAIVNGVEGVGYVFLFLGIGYLLFGGTSGGGFASWGRSAVSRMFGKRATEDEDRPDSGTRKRTTPEANPQAFWSVVGGFGYLFIGFWLLG